MLPLYLFDEAAQASKDDLFAEPDESGLRRRDAITDAGLAHFHAAYPGEQISKEDLFYYVYGILHSPDYRERFADNLSKELPRIPAVKKAVDFWTFSKAGRALADLHLNYETIEPYPLTIEAKGTLTGADYRVEKMKFTKKKDPETGKSVNDRSTVIYNGKITLKGIPEAAWDYVVNGKAALDWVMERQAVRTDKASGIVNDANDWAIETMGNPRVPAGAVPARGHRQPGNPEDRQRPAGVGYIGRIMAINPNQVPPYHELFNPLLKALVTLGGSASIAEMYEVVVGDVGFSDDVLAIMHGNSNQTEIAYRLAWARTYLKQSGYLENSARGVWSLTEKGRETPEVIPSVIVQQVQEAARRNAQQSEVAEEQK